MNLRPLYSHRSRGFTVTELLLAVAVIAVLIAILYPTFQGLREQSRTVQCLRNIKEVGKILLVYSAENQGIVVAPVVLQPPKYTSGVTWNTMLDQLGYLKIDTYSELRRGVMSCPSRDKPGSHVYNKMHYGVNRNVGFDCIGFANRSPFRITRIPNPSTTMLLGEVKKDYMIQTTSDTLMENIVYPHRTHANVFFYDGHAKPVQGPWLRPSQNASYPFY